MADALVVDTSAWIEFFKGTGAPADVALRDQIGSGRAVVVPEVVRMELLIGDPSDEWAIRRAAAVDAFDVVPIEPMADGEAAAAIHRACRRGGETVRNLTDCLVAVVALRLGLPLLHRDRDFDAIARHTELVLHQP